MSKTAPASFEGILLIDKPLGWPSFKLVKILRHILGIKKIGHAGTLDPLATGVMVMLIGRKYTRLSDTFLTNDKEYIATLNLGSETDTYDAEGSFLRASSFRPTDPDIIEIIKHFQGTIAQTPPMFSAKKVDGRPLYKLAREGKTIEREPIEIKISTNVIKYSYPELILNIKCSKGTYIRTIAQDIGIKLGCYAYLKALQRVKSGPFNLSQCLDGKKLNDPEITQADLFSNLIIP